MEHYVLLAAHFENRFFEFPYIPKWIFTSNTFKLKDIYINHKSLVSALLYRHGASGPGQQQQILF